MSARLYFAPLARAGAGVHRDLIRVVEQWQRTGTGIAIVLEGVRTVERQAQYVKQGRSQTMQSTHLSGRALDIWPCDTHGQALWPDARGISAEEKRARWCLADALSCELFEAADGLGIVIVNGRDWDGDGVPTEKDRDEAGKIVDQPHWQLPWPAQLTAARAGAARRIAARAEGERPIR